MANDYDSTTRDLLVAYPEPWLEFAGVRPDGPVHVVDANLSTVTAEADKVFRVDGPAPFVVHLEFQTSADRSLPRRLWRDYALIDVRDDLRVRSVALLFRPSADVPELTGLLDLRLPDGTPVATFHYGVVRVWQQPVAPLLDGPLGLLPVAPIADVPEADVPRVLHRVTDRISQEATPAQTAKLMEVTLTFLGLRFDEDAIADFQRSIPMMNIARDSSYPRLIAREGRAEGRAEGQAIGQAREARRLLRLLGDTRFGTPDEESARAIEAISDIDRLEHMTLRLLTATGWADLLATD
jgi:predicted transposase YdaD